MPKNVTLFNLTKLIRCTLCIHTYLYVSIWWQTCNSLGNSECLKQLSRLFFLKMFYVMDDKIIHKHLANFKTFQVNSTTKLKKEFQRGVWWDKKSWTCLFCRMSTPVFASYWIGIVSIFLLNIWWLCYFLLKLWKYFGSLAASWRAWKSHEGSDAESTVWCIQSI